MLKKLLSFIHQSIENLETQSHIIPVYKEEPLEEISQVYVDLPDKVTPIYGFMKAHIVHETEKTLHLPIPSEYYDRAISDIMTINEFLREAYVLDKSLNPTYFTRNDILFKKYTRKVKHSAIPNYTYDLIQNASTIEERVFTPQGKISKFPFILNFTTIPKPAALRNNQYTYDIKDEVFGKILYNQQGLPGRIEIINWHRAHCHQVIVTTKNNELSISAIYYTDNQGRKFKKYDRDK